MTTAWPMVTTTLQPPPERESAFGDSTSQTPAELGFKDALKEINSNTVEDQDNSTKGMGTESDKKQEGSGKTYIGTALDKVGLGTMFGTSGKTGSQESTVNQENSAAERLEPENKSKGGGFLGAVQEKGGSIFGRGNHETENKMDEPQPEKKTITERASTYFGTGKEQPDSRFKDSLKDIVAQTTGSEKNPQTDVDAENKSKNEDRTYIGAALDTVGLGSVFGTTGGKTETEGSTLNSGGLEPEGKSNTGGFLGTVQQKGGSILGLGNHETEKSVDVPQPEKKTITERASNYLGMGKEQPDTQFHDTSEAEDKNGDRTYIGAALDTVGLGSVFGTAAGKTGSGTEGSQAEGSALNSEGLQPEGKSNAGGFLGTVQQKGGSIFGRGNHETEKSIDEPQPEKKSITERASKYLGIGKEHPDTQFQDTLKEIAAKTAMDEEHAKTDMEAENKSKNGDRTYIGAALDTVGLGSVFGTAAGKAGSGIEGSKTEEMDDEPYQDSVSEPSVQTGGGGIYEDCTNTTNSNLMHEDKFSTNDPANIAENAGFGSVISTGEPAAVDRSYGTPQTENTPLKEKAIGLIDLKKSQKAAKDQHSTESQTESKPLKERAADLLDLKKVEKAAIGRHSTQPQSEAKPMKERAADLFGKHDNEKNVGYGELQAQPEHKPMKERAAEMFGKGREEKTEFTPRHDAHHTEAKPLKEKAADLFGKRDEEKNVGYGESLTQPEYKPMKGRAADVFGREEKTQFAPRHDAPQAESKTLKERAADLLELKKVEKAAIARHSTQPQSEAKPMKERAADLFGKHDEKENVGFGESQTQPEYKPMNERTADVFGKGREETTQFTPRYDAPMAEKLPMKERAAELFGKGKESDGSEQPYEAPRTEYKPIQERTSELLGGAIGKEGNRGTDYSYAKPVGGTKPMKEETAELFGAGKAKNVGFATDFDEHQTENKSMKERAEEMFGKGGEEEARYGQGYNKPQVAESKPMTERATDLFGKGNDENISHDVRFDNSPAERKPMETATGMFSQDKHHDAYPAYGESHDEHHSEKKSIKEKAAEFFGKGKDEHNSHDSSHTEKKTIKEKAAEIFGKGKDKSSSEDNYAEPKEKKTMKEKAAELFGKGKDDKTSSEEYAEPKEHKTMKEKASDLIAKVKEKV